MSATFLSSLDLAHTAVLSMDIQKALVSIYVKDPEHFLGKVSSVISRSRERQVRVLHVQVGFRAGLPEISSRNVLCSAIKSSPQHQQIFQGPLGAIHPAVAPEGEEIVMIKHRVSAFTGTDLSMIVRANEIHTLVMFGIATSGVVLSTALEAADADYRVAVVRDCCADLDADLHFCLLDRLLPRQAQVISADDFQ